MEAKANQHQQGTANQKAPGSLNEELAVNHWPGERVTVSQLNNMKARVKSTNA